MRMPASRHDRRAALSAAILAATSFLPGCAVAPEPEGGLELHFAALSAGGCQATNNGRNAVPDEVDGLTVVVDIEGVPKRYERASRADVNKAAQWLIGNVSANVPVDVQVFGCAGGKALWGGTTRGLQIEEQKETQAHVFLAPVGKLGCTGSEATSASAGESNHLSRARSLAVAAALPGGDAVVVGGLGSYAASGDGIAARDVDIYDHQAGNFHKGPQLLEARVWHHAFALSDRHVLVVGGATGASRYGDASLPTPLLMPKQAASARPSKAAELLDLQAGTAAVSTAAVGAGSRLLASAARHGDGLLFVGGVDDVGEAVKEGTLLTGLADVAAGGTGTSKSVPLVIARARPGMLRLHDGSMLVWGGNASGKATELGERLVGDAAFQALAIDGDAGLLASTTIATVAPQLVSLGEANGVETVLVFGGAGKALSTADVPSYAVRLDVAAGKATLVAIAPPSGKALVGGIAGFAKAYGSAALVSGGLVALSGGAPCAAGDDCVMDEVFAVAIDGAADAAPLALTMDSVGTFGGPRFGVAAVAIDAGILLAGGQSHAVDSAAAGDAVLDPTGRVVAAPPPAAELSLICK